VVRVSVSPTDTQEPLNLGRAQPIYFNALVRKPTAQVSNKLQLNASRVWGVSLAQELCGEASRKWFEWAGKPDPQ
jgi:hypothetical protein